MEKPLKGLFLTLEGGEGAGKTTLAARLKEAFEKEGREVLVTFEPGATLLGKELRELLLGVKKEMSISPYAELLLFLSDRAEHIHSMIRPALEQGKVVICDRYNDSTIAYQGFARGLDVPHVQELCEIVVGEVRPQITFFLDVDPYLGLERTRQEGENDRIEREELAFHETLRHGFHWLAQQERERIFILDASEPKDHVFEEAWKVISENEYLRRF
ncbi:MAG: dTMP kinase [Chlamydiia bacterium]|nr:dTMP kinase [Chlamydiia bacterium]